MCVCVLFLFGSISCRDFFVCRINPPSDHQKKWHMEKEHDEDEHLQKENLTKRKDIYL